MPDRVIRAQDVSKKFGSVTALERVSLDVGPGKIYGLIGPDGAGKSTLIKILASLTDFSSGSVEILGFNPEKNSASIRENIGYVSQNFGLYRDLTVEENIRFYGDVYNLGRNAIKTKSAELLEIYNLRGFSRRKAGQLSGGMKQKLSLICALVHSPKIVFLDEPTNGVDPVSRIDLWRILGDVAKKGTTVFISTSYIDEAERCDEVSLIFNGKIMIKGSPALIKRKFKGKIIEIICGEPVKLAKILKGMDSVADVASYGDCVHLLTFGKDIDVPHLRSFLREENFDDIEINPVEPALEDVLIEMIRGRDA